MRIGFDFDNTIACYDNAIKILATKRFDLPESLSLDKASLKGYLLNQGKVDQWTEFQGELYAPGMRYATVFVGVVNTIKELAKSQHELFIVSHRTKYPYAGPPYDLHKSAGDWIESTLGANGLLDTFGKNVFFLETLDEKIQKISELSCSIFVDDLASVLEHKSFPSSTLGLLFDPSRTSFENKHETVIEWNEILAVVENLS